MARPAGLEPATSWFVGDFRSRPIAADPGRMGSVAILRGREHPRLCTCPGILCNILQDRIGSFSTSRAALSRSSESSKRLVDDELSRKDRYHDTAAEMPAPWTSMRSSDRPPRLGNLDRGKARFPHFRKPIIDSLETTTATNCAVASSHARKCLLCRGSFRRRVRALVMRFRPMLA